MNNNYGVIPNLVRSNLFYELLEKRVMKNLELLEKRVMKKIEPFVLVALIIWLGYMYQLITATGALASNNVYYLY